MVWPTRVQTVADGQDTPSRLMDVTPAGLGTACAVQVLPSQLSVNHLFLALTPVAMHEEVDEQETAPRSPPTPVPAGWTFHWVPFQISTRMSLARWGV